MEIDRKNRGTLGGLRGAALGACGHITFYFHSNGNSSNPQDFLVFIAFTVFLTSTINIGLSSNSRNTCIFQSPTLTSSRLNKSSKYSAILTFLHYFFNHILYYLFTCLFTIADTFTFSKIYFYSLTIIPNCSPHRQSSIYFATLTACFITYICSVPVIRIGIYSMQPFL